MRSGIFVYALTSLPISSFAGFNVPLTRRSSAQLSSTSTSSSSASSNDPFGFQTIDGNMYTGVISVNGASYTVHVDTGSSDLWLDTQGRSLVGMTNTNETASIKYVDQTVAEGDILLANITWGEFSSSSQAFISAPGSNSTFNGLFQGRVGVGFPGLSVVAKTMNQTSSPLTGMTFMDNIFSLYPNDDNTMAFFLARDEYGVTAGGNFTIGEVDQDYAAVLQQPQLPVINPLPQWATLMDGVVINGRSYSAVSALHGAREIPPFPANKSIAVLDTGTSLGLAPQSFVDLMYGSVPGAQKDSSGVYVLPCDTKINVSMVFGEQVFPIHPIDLVAVLGAERGQVLCRGTFSHVNLSDADFVLGDAFLRNVYSVFNFGNWTEAPSPRAGEGLPFMQLLNITDPNKAWSEFDTLNNARINAFLQASEPSSNARSSSPSAAVAQLRLLYNVIILLLAVVLILMIVLIIMVAVSVRRQQRRGKGYQAVRDPSSAPLYSAPDEDDEHWYDGVLCCFSGACFCLGAVLNGSV